MSSSPVVHPVTEATKPFVQTTTPAIERANRLISLRAHPGFIDFLRLSEELVQIATDISVDFGGWDTQQIVILKARAQASKEHHQGLLGKLQEAIDIGLAEAREQLESLPEKTAQELQDQGDYVRLKVLQNFEKRDQDARVAGSY